MGDLQLSPRVLELVKAYREAEGDGRRGPRFVKVALALEQEMRARRYRCRPARVLRPAGPVG